ncbi:MAG: hypothetical protein C0631_05400 [Sedimenticola sp.]|nr:MAG: hypothetical protein C0631_05400 [Sedimenticola sp.]
MSEIGVVVLVLITLFVLFQLNMVRQAKKQIGEIAPDIPAQDPSSSDQPTLLYFHSPNCGPCRSMSPMIDALKTEFSNIHSIDVSQDLATAQQYNVRATPTLVLVKDGKISDVLLGQKSAEKIRSLLVP